MTLCVLVVFIFKSDPDFKSHVGGTYCLYPSAQVCYCLWMSSSIFSNGCFNLRYVQSSLRACRFIQDSLHWDWSSSLTIIWLANKCGPDISRVYRYGLRNAKFSVTNFTSCKFFWYYFWGWLQTYRLTWTKVFVGVSLHIVQGPLVVHNSFMGD